MNSYTKGPWKFVIPKIPYTSFIVRTELANDKGGKLIVTPSWNNNDGAIWPTKEESMANSRLMACAPEMVEMLLSVFAHVSHGGPTRAEAEALLKKAGVL